MMYLSGHRVGNPWQRERPARVTSKTVAENGEERGLAGTCSVVPSQ
jgi:hypothetical protein